MKAKSEDVRISIVVGSFLVPRPNGHSLKEKRTQGGTDWTKGEENVGERERSDKLQVGEMGNVARGPVTVIPLLREWTEISPTLFMTWHSARVLRRHLCMYSENS